MTEIKDGNGKYWYLVSYECDSLKGCIEIGLESEWEHTKGTDTVYSMISERRRVGTDRIIITSVFKMK